MAVITSNTLKLDDIKLLINGDIAAIHINAYYPIDVAEKIATKVTAIDLYGQYENAPLISRVGQAFFETVDNSESLKSYLSNSRRWIQEIRKACSPILTPIDKFRTEIDEIWPNGAKLATINNQKMFVGLIRELQTGISAEPHQDIFSWDAPNTPESAEVIAQFGMNVYLQTPPDGGALLLWDRSLSKSEYEQIRIPDSYGVDINKLLPPDDIIHPKVGDLVLLNSQRLHAIEASTSGSRTTCSCFVGYRGANQSLTFWS